MEELQGVIAEGQERGFLSADAIGSAVEEAELSTQQAQDLLSYLEEHGVEILAPGETAPELSEPIDVHVGRGVATRGDRARRERRSRGRAAAGCARAWRSCAGRTST